MIDVEVTADDFGYCKRRNKGMLELCKEGLIHKLSLLVNAVECIDAVSGYHKLPVKLRLNIRVGLHLNLTEGDPITEKSHIPSLLNDTGHFLGKIGVRDKLADLSEDELRKEIVSQIYKFKEMMGHLPSYVDGHQHIHVCPTVRDVLSEILYSHGIKETRIPMEPEVSYFTWLTEAQKCFFKTVCEDSLIALDVFNKRNVKSADFFLGLSTMGKNMTHPNLEKALKNILKDIVIKRQAMDPSVNLKVEFMVHPGYKSQEWLGGCGIGPDEFSMSDEREMELNFLRYEFKRMLLHLNLRLK